MHLDIDRLRVDPKYWNEVAPEGATHIHVYPDGKSQWMKVNLSGVFNYYWHSRFSEWQQRERPSGSAIAGPHSDLVARIEELRAENRHLTNALANIRDTDANADTLREIAGRALEVEGGGE